MGIQSWNHAPSGYQTVGDVVAKQNAVLQAISGGIRSYSAERQAEQKLEEQIKQHLLAQLKNLLTIQKKKENEAYAKLGVSDYEALRKKAEKWYNAGAGRLLTDYSIQQEIAAQFDYDINTNFNQAIKKLKKMPVTKDLLVKIFGEELKDFIASCEGIIAVKVQGAAKNLAANLSTGGFLTVFVQGDVGFSNINKNGAHYHAFSGGQGNLTKGVTIFQTPTGKGNFKENNFQLRFTSRMSQTEKILITDRINQIFYDGKKKAAPITPYKKIEKIVDRKLGKISDSRVRTAIVTTIRDYIVKNNEIAINRSSAAIKGALGEIYWNAFFRYFQIPGAVPAGVSFKRKSEGRDNGTEVPIDIALGAIGFQVKNYREEEGIVIPKGHFGKLESGAHIVEPASTSLRAFIDGGIQGDSSSLGAFLFSKSYNRRNIKYDPKGNYSAIEGRFDAIFNQLVNYFKANKAQVLSLDKSVELMDSSIADINLDAGRPVFFMINQHIIPSSVMIQDIYTSIETGAEANIKVTSFECDLSTNFGGGAVWPNRASPQMGGLNNKVNYTIQIDLHAFAELLKG